MNRISLLIIPALCLTLIACQATKDELGLSRRTPDEFKVIERAPLEIPANLTSLPKPMLGAPRPQETSATQQAQNVVLGNKKNATGVASSVENALLNKAGANNVPSDIRSVVNREAAESSIDKRPVIKRIMGIGSDEKSATVVDSEKEAERIKKQQVLGQKITGAATPTVEK